MQGKITGMACVDSTDAERAYRAQICHIGRQMYHRGLVVACEGNLSVRLNSDRMLITPAGMCKGTLAPEQLLITDFDGNVVEGNGKPSSEIRMHLLYYRLRPDVRAVCHAHPPIATAFAACGRALEERLLPEVVMSLGRVPLAPYGTPGIAELCAGLQPLVPDHDAVLLENHGVVTCGRNLEKAYFHLETVERFAEILSTAELLGKPRLLTQREIQKLCHAQPCPGREATPRRWAAETWVKFEALLRTALRLSDVRQ